MTRRFRLRRRLVLVLAWFVAIVGLCAAGSVVTASASRRALREAHRFETVSRQAALLSVIAREQYIHEAHTIILGDHSHVGHHDEWVEKLRRELGELRPLVDEKGERDLDAIADASREVSRIFAEEILPAIDRHDPAAVGEAHARANALVDRMTAHADALAAAFDSRATAAEREAEQVVGAAIVCAVMLGVLAAAGAVFVARSLGRSLSSSLSALETVAGQVARGDRSARVGAIPAEELAVVGEALNRMLDALERAEAEVVASERLATIGRIAAGVAHEINNPVAVIRGFLQTMLEEPQPEALRDELRILDEEAQACQRIAEDLLVYARQPALAPRSVAAAELLRDAVERAEGPPSRRSGGPEVAPVVVDVEDAMLHVDPLRIRQVIVNLIKNARQASVEGPVEILGRRAGDGYRIEVLDRGPGIPADVREHLFEPFVTSRREGTGLGLSVCYGLVTAHGGTIRAEERPGGGTRFAVELPAVVEEGSTKA